MIATPVKIKQVDIKEIAKNMNIMIIFLNVQNAILVFLICGKAIVMIILKKIPLLTILLAVKNIGIFLHKLDFSVNTVMYRELRESKKERENVLIYRKNLPFFIRNKAYFFNFFKFIRC